MSGAVRPKCAPHARQKKQINKLRRAIEALESRQMLAAHIVGSSTSYSTIQAAVDAAVAGQTITVDAGTYNEQVSVFKKLIIQGAQAGVDGRSNARGSSETIVTGATTANGNTSAFKIGGNDVTLDGFTIQGESIANATTGAGIVINPNISGTHIINDIVQNNSAGMYLSNASATDGALIQHNVFKNNNVNATATNNSGRGIYTDGSISGGVLQNVIIDGNFFTLNLGTADFDVQPAIGLEAATSASTQSNIQITNNVFDHNGKALLAMNADHITFSGNVVGNHYDTDSGSVRFEGNVHFVAITNNNLYGSGAHAIRIDAKGTPGSDDNFVINNNNIYDNGLEESGIAIQLVNGQYSGTLNLKNNWWGASSGPGGNLPGSGDGITTDGVAVDVTGFTSTYTVNPEVPYYGVASTATSHINAVDFDHGLEGVSYHDSSSGNAENQYRPNQDVDINTTTDAGSGFMVDDTKSGEWMKYTVNVTTGGTYTLSARVQSTSAGAKFHFELDGVAVSSSMTIPSNAAFQTVTQSGINLTAGTHVLRLVFDANNSGGNAGNWNWFGFALNSATQPPSAPTSLAAAAVAGQINLSWSNVANETGYKIERSPDGSTGWVQIGTTGADVTTYADTTVAATTPYFYRVRATNGGGDSGYSNTANATSLNVTTTTLLAAGSTWKYLDTGTNQGTAWTGTTFNDSTWKSGPSELGYGDGDEATVVGYGSNADNKFVTTYFRTTFNVTNPASISAVNLGLVRDDGAVIYVNGVEAFRSNMPTGTITYTTLAATTVGDADESTFFPGTINPALLVAGTNVIAVEIHQSDVTSSDISFNLRITATATIPATPPSAPSGLGASAISYNQINLTWTDTSSNETGFIIERSTDQNTWTQIARPGINATTYSDTTGLAGSTTYYYRVRATNSGGDSANATTNLTTPAAPSVPVAPTGLAATAVSFSQINLTWIDKSDNETGFIIDRSLDGSTGWTQISTPAANATTFSDTTGLSGSTTYYYRIRATNAVGPSANSANASATTPVNSTALPSGWVDGDIGTVGTTGSATYTGGVYTIKGAGADIWNTADSFNFAYLPLNGNGSITAQVNSMTNTAPWAKAGVMIRESLAAGAREASMIITPVSGSVFIYRTATDGSSDGDFSNSGVAPYWVRLTRSGTTFTAAISTNGTTWTTVGTQTISMGTTAYIGLAVASKVTGVNTATFSNVTMTGTIPGAPTGLTATPISATQINLSWADVSGEAGFKIERSTDNVTFTQIGTTLTGVTTYPDNTVSGTQTFYYRVKATNSSGDSSPSIVASAQPLNPPAAASGLTATSAGLTQINLVWVDKSSNETGFKIQRSLDGLTGWTTVTTTLANMTSYNDTTGLSSGTQYFYQVIATGTGGDAGASNIANATTASPTVPIAPANAAASASPNTLQINLTWTDKSSDETSFIIERSPNGNDTWTQVGAAAANATTYSDTTGLVAGTQYFYRISAKNNVGPSTPSNTASATTATAPSSPSGPGATASTTTLQINLKWVDTSSTETSFIIERSLDGATGWQQIGTALANATTYSDTTGLSAGTQYFYRVSATNVIGTSLPSGNANATTGTAPTAPHNLVATANPTQVQIGLTWAATSSNQTGFIIDRSPNGNDSWQQIGTALANATTYNDASASLATSTQYFYRVSATNSIGTSTPSNIDTATTMAAPPPTAPDSLAATAASTSLQIGLSWADKSSNETGFLIERSPDGLSNWNTVTTTAANATTYLDTTNLAAGTQYFYRVSAVGNSGNSTPSATASVTTGTAPSAATNASAAASTTALQITVTWKDTSSNEGGFLIERSPDGVSNWTTLTTTAPNAQSYIDTNGLTANTVYYYRVTAVNSIGSAAAAFAPSVTTSAAPSAPSSISTSAASSSQINLTWTDTSSNETGFVIERSIDQNTWAPVTTTAANAQSYSDTNLTPLTTYYYRVRAANNIGQSANVLANATTQSSTQLPSPMVDGDIGTTGITGSATYSNGLYTVKGGGTDVWNSDDSFNFAYQQMTGNCTIIARVASMQNTKSWAKAGIMIRNTLATNSAEVSNFMTPTDGVAIINRNTASASSALTNPTGSAPLWLKIVRSSNTFTTYSSTNGTTWTKTATFTVTMNSTVYIGLAVCSKVVGTLNTATFDNVSITSP